MSRDVDFANRKGYTVFVTAERIRMLRFHAKDNKKYKEQPRESKLSSLRSMIACSR